MYVTCNYKSDYKIIYSVILNPLSTDCTFKCLFALVWFQNNYSFPHLGGNLA